jgi:hypothetical protein
MSGNSINSLRFEIYFEFKVEVLGVDLLEVRITVVVVRQEAKFFSIGYRRFGCIVASPND